MTLLIFIILSALLLVVSVLEFIIIRGFMKTERSDGQHRHLTGREVEEVRRKISTVGIQGVTADDVINLIKTIRDTHLGIYVDDDPYIPSDPYDDIDQRR